MIGCFQNIVLTGVILHIALGISDSNEKKLAMLVLESNLVTKLKNRLQLMFVFYSHTIQNRQESDAWSTSLIVLPQYTDSTSTTYGSFVCTFSSRVVKAASENTIPSLVTAGQFLCKFKTSADKPPIIFRNRNQKESMHNVNPLNISRRECTYKRVYVVDVKSL